MLLTLKQTAEKLGISTDKAYNLVRVGALIDHGITAPGKVRHQRLFDSAEVAQYLKASKQATAAKLLMMQPQQQVTGALGGGGVGAVPTEATLLKQLQRLEEKQDRTLRTLNALSQMWGVEEDQQ